MELMSLKQLTVEDKALLLKRLGYETDGKFVLNEKGEVVIDKYVNVPVKLDRMLILPGSTLVLDDNELSILGYIKEHPDVL